MGRELQSRLWLLPRSRGLFSRRTEINGFRLQVLRTQGLQASINATASISSNLDKAFPFNTNHGKPLISVLLLNKPQLRRISGNVQDDCSRLFNQTDRPRRVVKRHIVEQDDIVL